MIATGALALGLRFVPADVPGRVAIAAASGFAALAGGAGWLVSIRIHFPLVWLMLLAAPILWNRHALMVQLDASRREWHTFVQASPRGAAAAVMLLGLASTGAWLPTMQMDDLTYHLNLPAQLAEQARYVGDPLHSAWAYAPWMGDVGQGIAWLLAGREARGAMNMFWLLSAAVALMAAARALGAAPVERTAILALFASFPPLVWLMAGMQTELPALAVLFALVALLLHDRQARHPYAATVLFAALAALKPMHIVAATPLLIYVMVHLRTLARHLPIMLAVFVVIAGSSYAHAAWHTGNPVFPLFNAFFESPYYPAANMSDTRWLSGFGPLLPWHMTFSTSDYLEAWNGGVGFLWIGLAGASLLALQRRSTRFLACVGLGIALIPLLPMQYARYAYPGLLLLLVPALCGSRDAVAHTRMWLLPVVLLCGLNLAYQANSGWTHHSAALKRAIRAPGAPESVLPYYVAERTLLRRLPTGESGIVLATDPQRGYVGELGVRGRSMSVHAPALAEAREAADEDPTGARWRAVFEQLGVRWILVTEAAASEGLRLALHSDPDIALFESMQGIELWIRDTD
ncbi:hypothetical protein AO715_00045 [Xanthomonas sp. Mitacek01]|nr:hypothetical protein AO715_00045 [Xanthomonas sp. Mitacek01]